MLSRSHRCIYGIVCAFACLIGTLGIGGCGSGGAGTQIPAGNISPVRAAVVVITQTMQFKATTTGDPTNSVSWSVDGVSGGNAVVGAISTGGAYTPPAAAGTHPVRATSTVDTTKAASATIAVTDLAGGVTYHKTLPREPPNPPDYPPPTTTLNTATLCKSY